MSASILFNKPYETQSCNCSPSVGVGHIVYSVGSTLGVLDVQTINIQSLIVPLPLGIVIAKPSPTIAIVAISGIAPISATLGQWYYVSSTGNMSSIVITQRGWSIQKVGFAVDTDKLLLDFSWKVGLG